MYPDHLQNCLDFGHGLLLFFIYVMAVPMFRDNLDGLLVANGGGHIY